MAQGLRSHLVGAGTHTHLEAHLSLMTAVRTGVLKSGGEDKEAVSCCCFFFSLSLRKKPNTLLIFQHFGFQVDLLHFGGKDLHAGVAHRGGESHSGNLPAGGAVLLWLTVAVRTLRLHRGHREDGRRPCRRNDTVQVCGSLFGVQWVEAWRRGCDGAAGRLTGQQLAVVQGAAQGSHAGAVVGDVPLLQCIGNLTVGLDPAQR